MTKIFGLKMEKVTESWRKFHTDELHEILLVTKYFSADQIKKNKKDGACDTMGGGEWKCLHGFDEKIWRL